MTNTERMIKKIEEAAAIGVDHVEFYVGKNTGNGPAVVDALRRRGFRVEKVVNRYRAYAKEI